MNILGIDPGGSACGLVVRDGDTLHAHDLVERNGDTRPRWVDRIIDVAHDLSQTVPVDLVAIEDLNDPTPQMGTTSVRGLIDTAVVIGALLAWAQDPAVGCQTLLVPPGRHGRAAEGYGRAGLLAAYPGLVGDRETSGAGKLRHVRSAWDVAGAAARQQLTLQVGPEDGGRT